MPREAGRESERHGGPSPEQVPCSCLAACGLLGTFVNAPVGWVGGEGGPRHREKGRNLAQGCKTSSRGGVQRPKHTAL